MNTKLILFAMSDIPLLLAQSSFDGEAERLYGFLKIVLNVVGLVMVVWSGIKFHDGQVREGTYALIGAFVVLLARVIVQELAGAAA